MTLGGMRFNELGVKRTILVSVSVIGFVVLCLLGVRAIVQERRYTRYTQVEYKADKAEYCPGDTLTFTPTLDIVQAPVTLELTTTFFEDDPPHSVGPRDLESSVARSIQLNTGQRTTTIKLIIPNIPPADDYRIIRALKPLNDRSITDYTSVPFAVSANCP